MFEDSADSAGYLRVRKQVRRLIGLGIKAGKPWWEATTVNAVATATKETPTEVIRLIDRHGYFIKVEKCADKPIGEWYIYEDGE